MHPNKMPEVEESVSTATWLPRLADFEYNIGIGDGFRLFEETPPTPMSPTPGPVTPHTPMQMDDIEKSVLGERSTALGNVPMPETPVVQRKQSGDGTRKSARKTKTPKRLESDLQAEINYRPRKSKYDIH